MGWFGTVQVCVARGWSRVKGYGAGCTLNSRLDVRDWSKTLAHVFTRNLCLHQYTPERGWERCCRLEQQQVREGKPWPPALGCACVLQVCSMGVSCREAHVQQQEVCTRSLPVRPLVPPLPAGLVQSLIPRRERMYPRQG